MEYQNVRKGITNAKFNEENSKILFGEIAIISILVGVGAQSWWWGGGIFLGLIVTLSIKPLAFVLMLLFSISWGVVGYGIGNLFGSIGAMVVLAILGFLIGAGVHFSALEWSEDIGAK
ncbi:MAG: hypothetical protein JRJ44_08230 [Deltaproteobacteria bacterium]|nr:hypothetical protein [Deltaproteobacteria bacterium]